jgi:GNAT superfamily N-acetyltransferase
MPVQELQFVRFYPKAASDDIWKPVIESFQSQFKERRPNDPVSPPQYIQRNLEMFEENLNFELEFYLIYSEDTAFAGWMLIGFAPPDSEEYEERKHVCFTDFYVLPALRRQGMGTQIMWQIVERASEQGVSLIEGNTEITDGHAFAKHLGASVGLEMRINRAYMTGIDWEMVEDWRNSGQERNPDTRIVCFDGLYSDNDAKLLEFCRVFSAALKEMPIGELEGMPTDITPKMLREEHEQSVQRGFTETYMVTVEADGRLSGVTGISYHPERGHVIGQGITGVPMAEQGRGLGKWLKAEMLIHIKERYPDSQYIDTGNAESNAPMRSINERVGFKLYSHNIFFKLAIEDVKKHLGMA